ncbi:peroxisomal membrane anchor protein conserved region-domain-containing protein [Hypoxylon argillaceum]|nr:peroxisomal membrane anchor protein conserved region-domain-containing protein [Hypoxylon argillaceum]
MGDPKKPTIPAWQQANTEADVTEPENSTLEHARQFLDDDTVKAASPEAKREFLKTKGLDDSQITQLLGGPQEESQSPPAPQSAPESPATAPAGDLEQETSSHQEAKEATSPSVEDPSPEAVSSTPETLEIPSSPAVSSRTDNPPPIITYPEFLTKPQRPPPLITPSRLANILAVSGGVWALIYGISGLAIRPMVDNLNEARSEYYDHVNKNLSQLVEKLEGAVSAVPYKNGKPLKTQPQGRDVDDNESTTSDPTELFHRDVGTQTSPPPSLIGSTSNTSNSNESPVDVQARHLSAISASLRELTLIHTQKAESNADLRSAVGEIREQADKFLYPPVQNFSVYGGLSYGQSSEPADEFKNAKDAIRSVKGLFLSSRSFPAVTTR